MGNQNHPPRITAFLARSSSKALVLRRGPSKYVQLIAWDTSNDNFVEGQWFCGRIYARLCDLSPCGKYFIYFAAKTSSPKGKRWIAISKPPFLHALALWPGLLTTGGGYFKDDHHIVLNRGKWDMLLVEGFALPTDYKLESIEEVGGDCYQNRLIRDGWKEIEREVIAPTKKSLSFQTFDLRVVHIKPSTTAKEALTLKMTTRGYLSSDLQDAIFEVVDQNGAIMYQLTGATWADWAHDGDLLYAADGKIYRLAQSKLLDIDSKSPVMLIDLTGSKFKTVEAPPWSKQW